MTSLVSNTFEGLGFIDRHMQNFVTQESSSLKNLFKISNTDGAMWHSYSVQYFERGLGFIDRHMQNFVTQESLSLEILFKISK